MVEQALPTDDLRIDASRNRTRVLEVARQLLETGDDSLPLNKIAKLAGVGVGTVYRHFPDRQVLLESLALGSFEKLLIQAQAAAAEEDSAVGLERLLRAALTCQLEDAGLAAVLRSSESACTETSALKMATAVATSRLLERARQAGVIRPDLDADELRRLLCGFEVAIRLGTDDQTDNQAEIERYVGILLSGLRPVPQPQEGLSG